MEDEKKKHKFDMLLKVCVTLERNTVHSITKQSVWSIQKEWANESHTNRQSNNNNKKNQQNISEFSHTSLNCVNK